ncbi:MAG: hypothetical protein JJV95_05980 [Sulfurospirillum sp.]|nr:hypothetical protein [Sulfurospirillum sp.]MBL0703514.1 hypothetical protein [Sulfurospirillum sp.]
MIIIGHPLIPFKPLYRVMKSEDIKKTKPNSTILIDIKNTKLLLFSKAQNINFALHVNSLKDACLANAIGAKYIIVDKFISKKVQHLATEYLFDSKILLQINSDHDIEKVAKKLIDGVIYKKSIL